MSTADHESSNPTDLGRSDSVLGWHSRGYLPHFDSPGAIQSVTFRLYDSVPAERVESWRAELSLRRSRGERETTWEVLLARIARYEDAGHGQCWLSDARIAAIVESVLLHYDGVRYRLFEWSAMPNHLHVLLECFREFSLRGVVRTWKSFSGREANRILGREGRFWAPDYFDRFIRDERHFEAVRRYIRENPVTAGLCATASDWPWGSARRG